MGVFRNMLPISSAIDTMSSVDSICFKHLTFLGKMLEIADETTKELNIYRLVDASNVTLVTPPDVVVMEIASAFSKNQEFISNVELADRELWKVFSDTAACFGYKDIPKTSDDRVFWVGLVNVRSKFRDSRMETIHAGNPDNVLDLLSETMSELNMIQPGWLVKQMQEVFSSVGGVGPKITIPEYLSGSADSTLCEWSLDLRDDLDRIFTDEW